MRKEMISKKRTYYGLSSWVWSYAF